MELQGDAYLVQGFFFQERRQMGIAFVPIEGAVATSTPVETYDMFAGIIQINEWGDWEGVMFDTYGESELTDVVLQDGLFRFIKRYEGREGDGITYELRPGDSFWTGRWEFESLGGAVNCVLTPVTEAILQPYDG